MGGGEGSPGALLPPKEYILYKFAICALGTEKRGEARVGGDEGYYFQEKLYKDPRPRLKTPKYTKKHEKTQKNRHNRELFFSGLVRWVS